MLFCLLLGTIFVHHIHLYPPTLGLIHSTISKDGRRLCVILINYMYRFYVRKIRHSRILSLVLIIVYQFTYFIICLIIMTTSRRWSLNILTHVFRRMNVHFVHSRALSWDKKTKVTMRRQRRHAVIMLAGLMNAFLGASIGYSAGILHLGLLEKHKKSPNLVSWAGALFTSVFCLAGPISSSVVNALSCRSAIFLGSFLSFAGFMVSSFVSRIEVVVFSYGIVAGLGHSMMYAGTILVTGFYFHDNPSVGTGVVALGAGIGVAVFPMFTEFLIETYGIDGTFLLLSGVSLQVVVFTMCIETHELENKRKESSTTFKMKMKLILQELRQIFSMGAYLQFCISIFCWSTSVNTCLLLLPEYYVSTGSTNTEAAIFMSLYGITGCFSRILTGLASSDPRVDGKLLYMGSYIILGLCTISLPLIGNSFSGKIFYSSVLGIYSSNVWSLLTPITIEIVGIQQMPTAFGMELLIGGIGFLIGPIIGGKIQRETDDFTFVFIISGFLYVLAGTFEMLMILTMAKSESFPNRNNMEKTVEVEEKLISSHVIEVKQLNDLSLRLSNDAGN